jgi:hypothetical protein
MGNEVLTVVRVPKDEPESWHIAAQGTNPVLLAEAAKGMARRENERFGVKAGGDVLGTDVDYLLIAKADLAEGYNSAR